MRIREEGGPSELMLFLYRVEIRCHAEKHRLWAEICNSDGRPQRGLP